MNVYLSLNFLDYYFLQSKGSAKIKLSKRSYLELYARNKKNKFNNFYLVKKIINKKELATKPLLFY